MAIRFDKLTLKAQEALRAAQDPLAQKILKGEILPGDTVTVGADAKSGELRFERGAVPVDI